MDLKPDATSVASLARLALPLAASFGLGFFIHFVNRTVLSWHSPEALAAALPAGMLAYTFQGLFIVACGYLGVFAAQHTSAGEHREAGAMVWPMFVLAGIGLLLSLVLIPFRHQLAAIFGTEPVVARGLAELLGWYLAEVGPLAAASGIAGFCGGLGRVRLVLIVSVINALICIALNGWLVFGGLGLPALGVTGAGLASLLTSLVMMGIWLGWLFARRQRDAFATWSGRNLDWQRLARFLGFALPRGATENLEMLAFTAFTAVLTRLGTEALSASNLAFNTYLLLMVPLVGFSQGISIAVGQAMGVGDPERARRVVRSAFILLGPYILLICLLFVTVPRLLLLPSHHGDEALWERQMAMAVPVMWLLAAAAPFDMLQWLWRSAVQGAGDTRWPLVMLVAVAMVLLAIPAWLLLPYLQHGLRGLVICYGLFVVYVVGIALVMWLRYARGPWPTMSIRH